jgi:hypothetical protein
MHFILTAGFLLQWNRPYHAKNYSNFQTNGGLGRDAGHEAGNFRFSGEFRVIGGRLSK